MSRSPSTRRPLPQRGGGSTFSVAGDRTDIHTSYSGGIASETGSETGVRQSRLSVTYSTHSPEQKIKKKPDRRVSGSLDTLFQLEELKGRFAAQFAQLCLEHNIPYVPEVVVLPLPHARNTEKRAVSKATKGAISQRKKRDRSKSRIRSTGSRHSPRHTIVDVTVDSSSMSTTGDSACLSTTGNSASQSISGDSAGSLSTHTVFLTSERSALDYFKPRIQVEQEDWQDDSTVTAVHISGWRVDTAMMSVLQVCWPGLAMLRCLRLTNVGLTGDAFTRMASSVAHCPCLTWLVLDQNPLAHAPLSALLRNRNTPWHLSLRFCGLGDLDVLQLAQRLGMSVTGYTLTSHSIVEPADDGLVSLNLSGNEIGDAGAGHLADALKSNRSLLVLNLAGNRLGDIGVARLARTLAWFPLTADEEKMRRVLIDEHRNRTGKESYRRNSFRILAKKRRSSISMSRHLILKSVSSHSRKTSLTNETDSLTNDESTTVLGRPRSLSLKKRKSLREPKVRAARLLDTYDKLRYKPSWYRPGDDAVDLVGPHPFQQTGFLRDGSLWLPGNRALVSLNVSRNRVARAGVQALLGAVREQMLPSHDGLPGLRRLVIHRNPIPPDWGQLQELCHLMERRDPAFRCPTIDLRKAWIMPCALPLSALM